MSRYVMLADLDRCVGCQTCTAACRQTYATSPAVQWRKVLDIEAGSYPNVSRTFVPVGCQHCSDPPCMHVCPTTATRQRSDGIVTIDYDICIGCAYCDVACPYQARFKIDAPRFAYGKTATLDEIERRDPSRIAVSQKCTFCSDRIDHGLANGMTPGVEPDATPACVNSCIANALSFGDLDDPNSNVSRLLDSHKSFRMHEEIGTQPGFFYLYDRASTSEGTAPRHPTPSEDLSEPRIRTKGVEPWHQQHWGWKAAGNFMCGGTGVGLFAWILLLDPNDPMVWMLGLGALGLVAMGLLAVLLKIGRPLRFIYVLRQPRRSWMAREAWVALALFPLCGGALLVGTRSAVAAAALVGLLFLYCQAMILKQAKGIPAWRETSIVPLILATGLAEGGGLFLAAVALASAHQTLVAPAAVAVGVLVVLRAAAWEIYTRRLSRAGAPTGACRVVKLMVPWFRGVGLVVPLVLIALGLVLPGVSPGVGPGVVQGLFALGGLVGFAAGWATKFVLITRAGYNQGFALARIPARGGVASGSMVKPGWTMPSRCVENGSGASAAPPGG